ncbi:MAG: DMT family transporter [Ruminococcus sp.]|nr:DMT family transporter [Ruminococcus sp.]
MNIKAIFQNPKIVIILALFCCALWGSAFPCVKVGYQLFDIKDAGSQIMFAGCRFFLAGVLTFFIASISEKKIIGMKKKSVPYILAQGILQTTIQYVFFYLGLAHTTGSKASVINASNVFFSIIAAHFLLKNENISMRKSVGCIIGFLGVIIVNLAPNAIENDFSLSGEGFVLICSIAYGVSTVTLKLMSDKENPTTITAYQLLFGGAVLLIIGMLSGGKVSGFTFKSTFLLLYLAVLSAVAFSIWTALLKYNPVGKVAVFGFSIPVFGALLSAVILRENIFSWNNLISLCLVSIGIYIVNKPKIKFNK